jgi:hypothetical protein
VSGGENGYHGRVALLIAGIDEAGYGPSLGPLCVGLSVFRIEHWQPGEPAPCLWRLLKAGVCRKPTDTRKRVPVADSKALKLANDCKTNHPLIHLERGVLAFLRLLDRSAESDEQLFEHLGARFDDRPPSQPWYSGPAISLPLGATRGEIAIAANRIARAMEMAGGADRPSGGASIEIVDLRCLVITERHVNETIRRTGSKADATVYAVGDHVRRLLGLELRDGDHLRIVCDQLGGRTSYDQVLARELPGITVEPLVESAERSRYMMTAGHAVSHDTRDLHAPPRQAVIQFMPEAESAHLPVALASMVAKLVRELAMGRFNRYWCSRCPELKPTAGYYGDARRWLDAAADVLGPGEREELVRLA